MAGLGCVGFKRVMINPVLFDLSEETSSMDERLFVDSRRPRTGYAA